MPHGRQRTVYNIWSNRVCREKCASVSRTTSEEEPRSSSSSSSSSKSSTAVERRPHSRAPQPRATAACKV